MASTTAQYENFKIVNQLVPSCFASLLMFEDTLIVVLVPYSADKNAQKVHGENNRGQRLM